MSAVAVNQNNYKLCVALRSGKQLQRTWLQPLLDRRGLTQAELGRQLAVQPSQIASWFNDRESIPPQHRLRMSAILALSTDEAHDLNCIAEATVRLREWQRFFQEQRSRVKPRRPAPYQLHQCFTDPPAIFDRFRAYAADYIEADAATTQTPCARVIYFHIDAATRTCRDLCNYLTCPVSTLFDNRNVWIHRYYPHHLYLGFFLIQVREQDGPGVIELQRQITQGLEGCADLINSTSAGDAKSAQHAMLLLSRYAAATFGSGYRVLEAGAVEELSRLASLTSDSDSLTRLLDSLADENPSARHQACMQAWNLLRQLDTSAASCPALLASVTQHREIIEQFHPDGALETSVQQLLLSLIRLEQSRGNG